MPQALVISTDSPDAIPTALNVLNQGGLIAFPTDTVYGLASRLDSSAAIEKLFLAKGRDFNKAIAVLIGDLEQINIVSSHFSEFSHPTRCHFLAGCSDHGCNPSAYPAGQSVPR